MKIALISLLAASLLYGCEREARHLEKPATKPDDVAQADSMADLQPGQEGRGMRALAAKGGYDGGNAYEVAQGKKYFQWYNCVGCHAHGGGAIGPALMDDQWIYGSKPDEIFATIMQGRPNGMPSFRGRIPEEQAWQIVAYVRSMSGLDSGAAPSRSEGLGAAPPEDRRKPQRPGEKSR